MAAPEAERREWTKVGKRHKWKRMGKYPVSLLAWRGLRRCIEMLLAGTITGSQG